jgi:hypothetical protein
VLVSLLKLLWHVDLRVFIREYGKQRAKSQDIVWLMVRKGLIDWVVFQNGASSLPKLKRLARG